MKRSIGYAMVLAALAVMFSECMSNEVRQYGMEGSDTIALNLTKDPNVGTIFVTHVNGEATGAVYKAGFMVSTGNIIQQSIPTFN